MKKVPYEKPELIKFSQWLSIANGASCPSDTGGGCLEASIDESGA